MDEIDFSVPLIELQLPPGGIPCLLRIRATGRVSRPLRWQKGCTYRPVLFKFHPGDELMAKNYQRDERNWRRQQQNRQEENQWSRGRQEDDSGWSGQGQQGRHWRDQEYNPRGGQETGRYWSRGQGMQGSPEQFGGGSEREVWEGGAGHRWGSERPDWGRERNYGIEGPREWQGERGWERGTEGWQGGRGGGWQGDRWQGVESRGRGWEGDYGTQY